MKFNNLLLLIIMAGTLLLMKGNIFCAPFIGQFDQDRLLRGSHVEFETEPRATVTQPLVKKDILYYDIYTDFTREIITEYYNHVAIGFLSLEELDSVLFDFVGNNVDSVTIEASHVRYERHEGHIVVYPDRAIPSGDSVQIDFFYWGEFPSTAIKHGFDNDGRLVIYSLFWPTLARTFFPCVDHPLDKALSSLTIRTNSSTITLSNGDYLGTEPAPDDTSAVIHFWQNDYPITTYNICFAMSDNFTVLYDTVRTTTGTVELSYFVPSSRVAHANVSFTLVPDMIAHFDSIFGEYPFGNCGLYITPFTLGAMEHQAMILLGSFVLNGTEYERLIAHEIAHQWWGNAVALADWRDFWLNEGMAVYSEYLHKKHFYGQDSARTYHRNFHQNAYRTYLPHEGEFSIYDPEVYLSYTVYRKGACVFHMLSGELGDSIFLETMSAYYYRYKHKNVTTDSLINFIEEFTGRDMSWFFDQWVYRAHSFPVLNYWWSDEDGHIDLHIAQVHDGLPYRLSFNIAIFQDGISHIRSITIEDEMESIRLDGFSSVDSIIFDLEERMLCDFHYMESICERRIVSDSQTVNIAPNPFRKHTRIDISGFEEKISLSLIDTKGNVIHRLPSGNSTTIDYTMPENLNTGIYLIMVSDNTGNTATKRVLYFK